VLIPASVNATQRSASRIQAAMRVSSVFRVTPVDGLFKVSLLQRTMEHPTKSSIRGPRSRRTLALAQVTAQGKVDEQASSPENYVLQTILSSARCAASTQFSCGRSSLFLCLTNPMRLHCIGETALNS
jgi:hypothetical protein